MTKSKYKVFVSNYLINTYVTTTRNSEDMINEILKQYEWNDCIKIVKITEDEQKVIYRKTPKNKPNGRYPKEEFKPIGQDY